MKKWIGMKNANIVLKKQLRKQHTAIPLRSAGNKIDFPPARGGFCINMSPFAEVGDVGSDAAGHIRMID